MKHYHKNPRRITPSQLERLQSSLETFGDLGVITHDLSTDEIISGNQRMRALSLDECEIEIVHQYDEPDSQGTIAVGYAIWHGNRYAYRQVHYDDERREQANIQANRLGGEWDLNVLESEFDRADLMAWGFEDWEIAAPVAQYAEDEIGRSPRDMQDDFVNATIRQIVLVFAMGGEYERMVAILDQIQEYTGIDNNSDAVASILEEWANAHDFNPEPA